MGIPQPWVLSTDRTEWSFGTTRFNILLLGIVHEGVAYPHELPLEGRRIRAIVLQSKTGMLGIRASAAWLLRRLRLEDVG